MLSVVAILLLIALLAIGVPIFAALGVVSIGMLALEGRPLFDAALTAISGLNSSAFVAVLFFVIAAKFMQSGGIARVLIEAAEAWVGWLRGGLGLVAVLGTTLFAAVSGSSVVTAMTMGTLLIPLMIAKRYDRPFALGTIGAAGTLGILIPPSLSMILYGLVANESVARLFLAGVVPGLLQALMLGVFVVLYSRRKNFVSGERLTRAEFVARNVRALPALLDPARRVRRHLRRLRLGSRVGCPRGRGLAGGRDDRVSRHPRPRRAGLDHGCRQIGRRDHVHRHVRAAVRSLVDRHRRADRDRRVRARQRALAMAVSAVPEHHHDRARDGARCHCGAADRHADRPADARGARHRPHPLRHRAHRQHGDRVS